MLAIQARFTTPVAKLTEGLEDSGCRQMAGPFAANRAGLASLAVLPVWVGGQSRSEQGLADAAVFKRTGTLFPNPGDPPLDLLIEEI